MKESSNEIGHLTYPYYASTIHLQMTAFEQSLLIHFVSRQVKN